MSKDNWKGTSGWGTIDDPTGVLSGRVLVATGGDTTTEDYVLTEIGTSNTFSLVHYSVLMNYAWNQSAGTHPMNGGNFSVVARATTYTGSPALAYNCYLGQIDVQNNLVKIIRRYNNIEYILAEVALPDSAKSRGTLHSLELRCYDTDPVTLQVFIDSTEILTVGDTDAKMKLTSGDAGIQSQNGTVYIDNFAIYEYTSDGTAPVLWTPSELTNVVIWLKADVGVTTGTSDDLITLWEDQSGNSNDLTALSTQRPTLVSEATNGLDVIDFDGTANLLQSSTTYAGLDLNSSSGTIFIVCNPDTIPSTGGTPADNRMLSKGASYGLGVGDTSKVIADINGGQQTSNADAVEASSYQIVGIVYNGGAVSDDDRYGFWVDGSNVGSPSLVMAGDNSSRLVIGSVSSSKYFDGKIAEVLLFNEELTIAQRQLIEGYLAHRWATWPSLPTDHPYYRLAPTT